MPAGTLEPSGQIVGGGGGGGGGGGQGWVMATCEPSAQVCIAGARGVVAQAEIAAVATMRKAIRFIFHHSLFSTKPRWTTKSLRVRSVPW